MKFSKYLTDKYIEILLVVFGYIIVLMMLLAFKVSSEVIIGITIVFVIINCSVIATGYFKRRRFYDYLISNVLSWVLAVLFAYITNKIFVFESKSKKNVKEITSFFFFRIISLVIEMIILYIFVDMLHIDDLITKIIAQVIVIVANYVFSKVFVFKKD